MPDIAPVKRSQVARVVSSTTGAGAGSARARTRPAPAAPQRARVSPRPPAGSTSTAGRAPAGRDEVPVEARHEARLGQADDRIARLVENRARGGLQRAEVGHRQDRRRRRERALRHRRPGAGCLLDQRVHRHQVERVRAPVRVEGRMRETQLLVVHADGSERRSAGSRPPPAAAPGRGLRPPRAGSAAVRPTPPPACPPPRSAGRSG